MLNTKMCLSVLCSTTCSSYSMGPVCLHRPVLCNFLWQGEVSSSLAVEGNICASVHCSCMVADAAPQNPRASRALAEFHMCRKHHTVLWLHLGRDSLPGGHSPGCPGIATLRHLWLVSTLPQQDGGSSMSWAQPQMGKATCAGPQVTSCCLQVFLLPMEMCLQVFWRWICWCVFIVQHTYGLYFLCYFFTWVISFLLPFSLSLYCLW